MHKLIQSKFAVLCLLILVLFSGWISFNKLNVEAFPDISPKLVQVFTQTQGLAPEEIETYITIPLERAMSGLPSLSHIRSVSNYGLSVVNIYFEEDTDIYLARQLVNEQIQTLNEAIPSHMGTPSLGPISTGMGLVMFYYLEDTTQQRSLTEMREIQDWLVKTRLQNVQGVTEVLGIGGYEKQIQIQANPLLLQQYNIDILELSEAIESSQVNTGAQFFVQNSEEIQVRSLGTLERVEDFKDIFIKNHHNQAIRLSDLAEVKIGGQIRRGLQSLNGVQEVVSGMVIKLLGSNSSQVISSVEEELQQLQKDLPQGVVIRPYYEQKSLIEACIQTIWKSLSGGILLVVIMIVLFNGSIRPSLIVALSIPFSVAFAWIGMYLFDISANLMSIGGIVIAIGMMVDDSIVMVENSNQWLKRPGTPGALGESSFSRAQLILKAFREIKTPLIFSTLIVLTVFSPILSLSGVEGTTFRPMAYSLILAMTGSLIFATLISPTLSLMLLQGRSTWDPTLKLHSVYQKCLRRVLQSPRWVLSLSLVLLTMGVVQFQQLGSEFTPKLNEGTIVLRLTMGPSISLESSLKTTQIVERQLMQIPEITQVVTRVGRGEVGAHADPINSAEIFINLKPQDQWRVSSQDLLQELIRKELGDILGAKLNFTQPIAMSVDELLEGVKGDLALKLKGPQLSLLKEYSEKISQVLEGIPGARDIQVEQISGVPQLQMKINRQAILRYGIHIQELQKALGTLIGGAQVGTYYEDGKTFPVQLRAEEAFRSTPEQMGQLQVKTQDGHWVPLKELMEITQVEGPRQISRENNQRLITIQANVSQRDIGSFVQEAQAQLEKKVQLPDGYYLQWGGQYKLKEEANARFTLVIPLTLLAVLILLYMSYQDMRSTLIIFINIPFALVGGVFSLQTFQTPLSVPASIGFIALLGIALGNGMVLVSQMNQSQDKIQACLARLKPILLTALTTSIGILPMIINTGTGSEIQRPLAIVMLGGMFTSTLTTLIILPLIYSLLQPSVAHSENFIKITSNSEED